MFSYKKFAVLCAERNVFPSAVAAEIGLSNAAASGWKKGKQPRADTIKAMAAVLRCDPEDLMDAEPEEKETPTPETEDGLSDADRRLIEWFRSLPPEKQKAILIAQDAPADVV